MSERLMYVRMNESQIHAVFAEHASPKCNESKFSEHIRVVRVVRNVTLHILTMDDYVNTRKIKTCSL